MELTHGTAKAYCCEGCHCVECSAAWAKYIRERRHKLGLAQPRAAQLVASEIAAVDALVERVAETDQTATVKVPLSPLGLHILAEVQRKTGKRRGELLDELLREHGASLLDSAA